MEIKRTNSSDECGLVKRVQGRRGRKHTKKDIINCTLMKGRNEILIQR